MADDATRNIADELTAIKAVAEALQPLGDAARHHVIAYVAEALRIDAAPAIAGSASTAPVLETAAPGAEVAPATTTPLDIRSLKEQKQPGSANEMAALVAYYVSELLPPDEQRQVITSADIEKYFKQANFRLPSRVAQTLPDAARAGYFDAVDRGQYKLNPVGYNLVAHGMPSGGGESPARPAKPQGPGPAYCQEDNQGEGRHQEGRYERGEEGHGATGEEADTEAPLIRGRQFSRHSA